MESIWLGNPLNIWIRAAFVAGALFAFTLAVRYIVAVRWARVAARTSLGIDDLIVAIGRGTRTWFLAFAALSAGAQLLTLSERTDTIIRLLTVFAGVVQAGMWGNIVVRHLIRRYAANSLEQNPESVTTLGALSFVARLIIWTVLVLVGLDNLGVNITTLIAGLGVGGVAVALAVQNILGDLFASLSIVLDKPFVVGDFIIVDDLLGTVEYVGLKTTRIRSLHGEQIIFSNGDLLNSRIRNYKKMQERRVVFTVRATMNTSRDQLAMVPNMIRSIIENLPGVRFDRSHFKGFAESSFEFEVVYYVLSADYNVYMDKQQAINLAIVDGFKAAGIEFAVPARTLQLQVAGGGREAGIKSIGL